MKLTDRILTTLGILLFLANFGLLWTHPWPWLLTRALSACLACITGIFWLGLLKYKLDYNWKLLLGRVIVIISVGTIGVFAMVLNIFHIIVWGLATLGWLIGMILIENQKILPPPGEIRHPYQ